MFRTSSLEKCYTLFFLPRKGYLVTLSPFLWRLQFPSMVWQIVFSRKHAAAAFNLRQRENLRRYLDAVQYRRKWNAAVRSRRKTRSELSSLQALRCDARARVRACTTHGMFVWRKHGATHARTDTTKCGD